MPQSGAYGGYEPCFSRARRSLRRIHGLASHRKLDLLHRSIGLVFRAICSVHVPLASLWAGRRRQGVELSIGAAAERRAQLCQAESHALVPKPGTPDGVSFHWLVRRGPAQQGPIGG